MYSELFAHDVVSGAQPSTVAPVTPGTSRSSARSRSMNAGADAVLYCGSGGLTENVMTLRGSIPMD